MLAALAGVTASTALRPAGFSLESSTSLWGHSATVTGPTYYHDIQPILQKHCVICHIAGGIAPMSFDTYENAHRYAFLIRNVTQDNAMPPAFAVPLAGNVTNNPALTARELAILADWANAKAPEGSAHDTGVSAESSPPWSIPKPDLIVSTPDGVEIPATGLPGYVYEIVPTHFRANRWVQMAEVMTSSRANVLQIVVAVRVPGSPWLRSAPIGKSFASLGHPSDFRWANDDILAVFAPGSPATRLSATTAKLIPAGADLVFRVQYLPNEVARSFQSSVGMVFSKQKPLLRAATLAIENAKLEIPPEGADYQAEARGAFAKGVTLLNLFPQLHLRGKQFEVDVLQPAKDRESELPSDSQLLRVNYDRRWQPVYSLSEPLRLHAGMRLRAVGIYDNSANNPANPDPHSSVHWGGGIEDEVLQLFFDVAIPSEAKKEGILLPD